MIIFLRIAWMIRYQGVTAKDSPSGAGHFVDENLDGGEVMNFLPVRTPLLWICPLASGPEL